MHTLTDVEANRSLMQSIGARQAQAATHEDNLLTQRETAHLLSVSVSYPRASSCLKHLLPGNGPRGRPPLRYRPDEVLELARSVVSRP